MKVSRVSAIKIVRNAYLVGLREAKDCIDALYPADQYGEIYWEDANEINDFIGNARHYCIAHGHIESTGGGTSKPAAQVIEKKPGLITFSVEGATNEILVAFLRKHINNPVTHFMASSDEREIINALLSRMNARDLFTLARE